MRLLTWQTAAKKAMRTANKRDEVLETRQRRSKANAKKASKASRKQLFMLWMNRHQTQKYAILGLSGVLFIGLSLGGGYWSWQSGYVSAALIKAESHIDKTAKDAGFSVKEIYVTGRKQVDKKTLLALIDVKLGEPLYRIDTDAIRERLEALGWVKQAVVGRSFSGRIVVQLKERHPIAIWQHGGRFDLVDSAGIMIGPEGLDRFKHLKVVVGDFAPNNTRHLMAVLDSAPELKQRVQAAVWIGNRRWNLRLKNGIDIRLPEQDPIKAWERLEKLQEEHDLLERDVEIIDLRQIDRLVVRMTDKAAAQIKLKGDET